MILEFLQNFHFTYNVFILTQYLLQIFGTALILYIFGIFCLIVFTLFKSKNLDTIKALHTVSIVEVYCFTGIIIGVILTSKIYGLLFFKILLFLIIVIFNGVTVTRLLAKTAYFYNLRFKKLPKRPEQEEE
jgi:hypothetical protein